MRNIHTPTVFPIESRTYLRVNCCSVSVYKAVICQHV